MVVRLTNTQPGLKWDDPYTDSKVMVCVNVMKSSWLALQVIRKATHLPAHQCLKPGDPSTTACHPLHPWTMPLPCSPIPLGLCLWEALQEPYTSHLTFRGINTAP